MVERGEQAYARWGRLAVFFTPAIVSGTAKMRLGQFALWNLVASFAFAFAVAASTYGVGRLVSGNPPGSTSGRWWWGSRWARSSPCSSAADGDGWRPGTPSRTPPEPPAATQRGKPRMRPAMMSRWTCEVPPAMPAALLHSH